MNATDVGASGNQSRLDGVGHPIFGVEPNYVALWRSTFVAWPRDSGGDRGGNEGGNLPLSHVRHAGDQSELAPGKPAGPQPINTAHFQICDNGGCDLIIVINFNRLLLGRLITGPPAFHGIAKHCRNGDGPSSRITIAIERSPLRLQPLLVELSTALCAPIPKYGVPAITPIQPFNRAADPYPCVVSVAELLGE